MGLLDLFTNIRDDIRAIRKSVQSIEKAVTYRLPRPAPIELADIKTKAEVNEGNVIKIVYEIELKPVEDTEKNKDVISRKLVTLVDGTETGSQEIPRDVSSAIVKFPKGATSCVVRGSYVDDDGNEGNSTDSAPFTAVDDIKPDAPGADFATIKSVGEVDEE